MNDLNWDVYPWALGAASGHLPLNVMDGTELSSFRRIAADGETGFAECVIASTVMVPVKRLDDALREVGLDLSKNRVLLKTDTQGYDLEVLRGAPKTARQSAALLCEVSQLRIYEGAPDFLDAIREMRSYGFDIAAMAPVTFHNGVVIEFDCLLKNRSR